MLRISSLEKFYINSHTQALKGVSFDLPHKGLVNLRGNSVLVNPPY